VFDPGLTIEQRRALQMMAETSKGCTDRVLRRCGVSVGPLVELVAAGYAVTEPHRKRVAGKTAGVVRFVITDAGRTAIGCCLNAPL
jgi:hypothetical protein